jgi:hypothetical protein
MLRLPPLALYLDVRLVLLEHVAEVEHVEAFGLSSSSLT